GGCRDRVGRCRCCSTHSASPGRLPLLPRQLAPSWTTCSLGGWTSRLALAALAGGSGMERALILASGSAGGGQGWTWKRPEECSPRGCRWRPPKGSALPSFLAEL